MHDKIHQDLCAMVKVLIDELRFICLDQLDAQHDARLAVTNILDLTTLLRLEINSPLCRQAIIDPATTHTVHVRDGCVCTDPGRQREVVFTILIDIDDQIVHKHLAGSKAMESSIATG